MADVKISALPAASTPLAGTEVLPIVQSGTTDKVSVADLTAGRTVNASAFSASGTVSGATVTASGTVSGATVSGTTVSGTTVTVGAGTAALPSLTPTGDTNTGLWAPAADTLAFSTNGSERLRIASAGQLGIGGTNYGTSGQVLTSTGNAAPPAWQTPGSTFPAFSAYNNLAQTGLTLNTYTKVNFDIEEFDTTNSYNPTLARFTPNLAGYYQVNFSAQGGGSVNTAYATGQLYKNGSGIIGKFSSGLNGGSTVYGSSLSSGSALVFMNGTTDYLEFYLYIQGSGTGSIFAQTGGFSAFFVRAA